MGQVLQADRIGTISHSVGVVSLTASIITIGGQQYSSGVLNRTITDDVTLVADSIYMVYAVVSGGALALRISTNVNSVGPAGFVGWKLVGAFWTNPGATFDLFANEYFTPDTIRALTSGSGTYTTPPRAKAIRVRMCGGGGSGGTLAADGNGGSATTFGSLTANGGSGGGTGGVSTAGGTATGGDINLQGGGGMGGGNAGNDAGGQGGTNPFGGNGAGARDGGGTAQHGTANTGAGGGGGTAGGISRAGGAAGGYCEKLFTPPSATYAYSVGAGGTAPANAGNGGSGVILITEMRPNMQELRNL